MNEKDRKIKISIPLILLTILPISIIIGSAISLINLVFFSLCIVSIYFSKNDIKIYDLKPLLFLIILYLYLIFNSLISVDITSGIYTKSRVHEIYPVFSYDKLFFFYF